MTSHTITDPPHRRLGNPSAKFEAWIKTSDGYFVELQIGAAATQEQAERFVREAVAAPDLLAALQAAVASWDAFTESAPNRFELDWVKQSRAAIAKATGTAP